jgi:predicted N-formylglutamate amidohydrolase
LEDKAANSPGPSTRLLVAGESPPVIEWNQGAGSPFLLIGDHAGCEVPARLHDLGLPASELTRHIGWDIGVAELGAQLAEALDAGFIGQRFSRLVIDCNRDPARPDAICTVSDATLVPGNADISDADRQARIDEVFAPYHQRIADELAARGRRREPAVLVALHSFTPVMAGEPRPWRYGVLHLGASPFSAAVLAGLRRRLGEAVVGDNQPYQMDETDFTIPHHVAAANLDYVELEVRQDLLGDPTGVRAAAELLAAVLREALAEVSPLAIDSGGRA